MNGVKASQQGVIYVRKDNIKWKIVTVKEQKKVGKSDKHLTHINKKEVNYKICPEQIIHEAFYKKVSGQKGKKLFKD